MSQEEPAPEPVPDSPWFAVFAALFAIFMHALGLLTLLGMVGLTNLVAALGMSAVVAYPLAFTFLAARSSEPPPVLLGLVPARRGSALAVLLLLASLLLTSEIDNLTRAAIPPPGVEGGEPPETRGLGWQLFLVYVVVMPLAFELFYRGALQPRLVRMLGTSRGIFAASSLSAIGVSFYNPWLLLPSLAAHSLLGILRHCSGSVRPAVTLHALTGVVIIASNAGIFGIPGFDDLSAAHTPARWLVPSALITGLGLWQCRRLLDRL